jgi:hypothetical protein
LQTKGNCSRHEKEDDEKKSLDQIADFPMKKSSSPPLEFDFDFSVFDKYNDDEEDFKDSLTNKISSSPTFHQRNNQPYMHVVFDESCEYDVPKSKENPFHFDISSKDIIVEEGDYIFFHDTFSQNHLSFNHYQDNDVKDQEHTFYFLSKTVSCDRPTYHYDEFKL